MSLIKKIIARENRTANILLVSGIVVRGNVYFNDKTGSNLNDLKGVILGPIPSETDHSLQTRIKDSWEKAKDRDIIEITSDGGFYSLEEVLDIWMDGETDPRKLD